MFQIRLKELRESHGLSQADLARAIHTKQSTVAMWENGTNRPRNVTLEKLANYFGVPTDYLLGRTDEKKTVPGGTQDGEKKNLIRIIGRDGSYEERYLTDEQLQAMKAVVKQMPKVEDDF